MLSMAPQYNYIHPHTLYSMPCSRNVWSKVAPQGSSTIRPDIWSTISRSTSLPFSTLWMCMPVNMCICVCAGVPLNMWMCVRVYVWMHTSIYVHVRANISNCWIAQVQHHAQASCALRCLSWANSRRRKGCKLTYFTCRPWLIDWFTESLYCSCAYASKRHHNVNPDKKACRECYAVEPEQKCSAKTKHEMRTKEKELY